MKKIASTINHRKNKNQNINENTVHIYWDI